MDEYPTHSLDHSIPLLVTLGLPSSPGEQPALVPDLTGEAILLRSELPAVEGEQGQELLRYIRSRDASSLPWNSRDATTKYRLKVKAAGRVRQLRTPQYDCRNVDGEAVIPTPPSTCHTSRKLRGGPVTSGLALAILPAKPFLPALPRRNHRSTVATKE